MKKALLFIAVATLYCTGTKAQDIACAFNTDNSFQTSLSEQPQTTPGSIYSLPMPTTDFATGNQFNTQQYASAKGWGIACIVTGGVTLLSGAFLWLGGGIFTSVSNNVSSMDASMNNGAQDPEMQQGLQRVDNVGKGIKTVGIVATATGAVLVGTGIVLLTSDSGGHSRSKSTKPHRVKRRRGHARSNPRHAELMPDYRDMQPDWSLCLNVGPTSTGLTLSF